MGWSHMGENWLKYFSGVVWGRTPRVALDQAAIDSGLISCCPFREPNPVSLMTPNFSISALPKSKLCVWNAFLAYIPEHCTSMQYVLKNHLGLILLSYSNMSREPGMVAHVISPSTLN